MKKDYFPGRGCLRKRLSVSSLLTLLLASVLSFWVFADTLRPQSQSAMPALSALSAGEVSGRDPGVHLSARMLRVRDWVAKRYRVPKTLLEPALLEAEASAARHDLDPLLLVAMMAIESSFNPSAQSHRGAQGLMQVIPRYHQDKIGADADEDALFDPVFNVQIGTSVLAEGLQRYGTLERALQYYGGARRDPKRRYSKKVLKMKNRISAATDQRKEQGA